MRTRMCLGCFISCMVLLAGLGCSDDSQGQADTGVVVDASVDGPLGDAAFDAAFDTMVAPSGVGRACGDDTACELGDVCLNATKNPQMPGGYCTRTCISAECGGDAICGKIRGLSLCLKTCTKDQDCRSGYVCESSLVDFTPVGEKICVPGKRTAKLGDTCTDDSSCAPGKGICFAELKDGYCSAFCDPKVTHSCGTDGECMPRIDLPLGGLCAKTCTQDSQCRGGAAYACADAFGRTKAQGKVCAPGTKGVAHGTPCTQTNDCTPGMGICLDEAFDGMPGGYCSMRCDTSATPDPCGAGAQCVRFPGGEGLCLDNCSATDTCRKGYSCIDKFIGVAAVGTVCAPGQTLTAVAIGANCVNGADCSAGSEGCIPDSPFYPAPGGYCTAICSGTDGLNCPAGSACVGRADAGNCFASCQSDADCQALRTSGSTGTYACARRLVDGTLVDGVGKVCTAINPAAKIGDACTNGVDCNGEFGRCIFDTNPASSVRFANGYCTVDCNPQAAQDTCGAGAVCHDVSKGSSLGGSCVKTCTANGDCRTTEGYSCKASSKGTEACLP